MFFLIRKLKSALLWLLRVFRRVFCCFRIRSGHDQLDDVSECLTHVGVVPNRNLQEAWSNEWCEQKESPQTVDEHIQLYREKLSAPAADPTNEAVDQLFQELEPQITKQKRVVIAMDKKKVPDKIEHVDLSRLSAISNYSSELGEWIDESASGWDEQQLDPTDFIRQQKRSSHARTKFQTTKLAA